MSAEVDKFKIEYNYWLKRRLKAEQYFDENPKTCFKFQLQFNKVTARLSLLPNKYKRLTGVEMTDKEILEGFEEVLSWD
ncbi:MAG: hypothetical protein ACRDA4_08125 [Filifactoraceae bacterium]